MAGVYTGKGIIGGSTICRHSSRTPGTYTRTSGNEELQSSFPPAVKALRKRLTPPGDKRLDSYVLAVGTRFHLPFFFFLSFFPHPYVKYMKIYCDGPIFMFSSTASQAASIVSVLRGCFRSCSIREGMTTQRTDAGVKSNAE